MLEIKDGLVLCGVMKYNGDWCEIYVDEDGTVVFEEYENNCAWCLSEINVPNPKSLPNVNMVTRMIENGDMGKCIGAIFYNNLEDFLCLIDENTAVPRKTGYWKKNVGKPIYYSSDIQYDLDDFE